MHDPTLEQNLRAALQTAGDALPFTITSAELERRLALRRQGRLSPMASLGLAAAVGVGLLGLVGVAGGWFEQRSAPSPSLPVASESPSPAPSASADLLLPSVDEIINNLDPATIVRAQEVGPAAGPSTAPARGVRPARSVTFAPIAQAGAYRVWTACLGRVDVSITVTGAGAREPREELPVACNGLIVARQVGIEAGDTIAVGSSSPTSWRLVLEAPARDALHATSLAEIKPDPDVDTLLMANSELANPDYDRRPVLTEPASVGNVAQRDRYRVLVSCAGPDSIRYAFGVLYDDQNPPDPLPEDHSLTEIECDGALHEDLFETPLPDGARFLVTAQPRTAWRIAVTSDKPPIAIAPDVPGWQLSSGAGPNYLTSGNAEGIDLIGPDDGGPVRVVITCAGPGTLTGTIDVGSPVGTRLDPYSIDCSDGSSDRSLERVYEHAASSVQVLYDPHGAIIWLAVTSQIRATASPAP
jgi:hypothetical protein